MSELMRPIPFDKLVKWSLREYEEQKSVFGIKMIAKAGFSDRNLIVLGVIFGLGLGLGAHPEAVTGLPPYIGFLFKDTVACVCVISILANMIFPSDSNEK